jgi:dihydrofolate reductase
MRKIIGGVYLSLDGIMQAPGGPTEDPSDGFALGGWMVPHADEKTGTLVEAFLASPHDLLLGRKTYDIFVGYWPHATPGNPVGVALNTAAKHVLTHRGDALGWANSHPLVDLDALRALKATEGPDLFIWGSSSLYPQLFAAGLIDGFTVMTFPVVLGTGKRLFGPGTPPLALRPISTVVSSNGVIIATYEPAGPVKTGTFPGEKT